MCIRDRNQDSGEIKMKAGNTFSYITNVKPNTNVEKLAQTGYEVEAVSYTHLDVYKRQ